jgi:methylmalonyl-CoA mutase cobalamin-binding subunit
MAGDPEVADPVIASWLRTLVGARRPEIDGRLLDVRGSLGSWCLVADEVGRALVALGQEWASGRVTIAQEHATSDALARAIARIGDALPLRLDGPGCLLACAGDDEHTLGLSLAELTARERGWVPLWLGRCTPTAEVVRLVASGQVAMVALSASSRSQDEAALEAIAGEVGAACSARGVPLVLGGAGAWPERLGHGIRLTSFTAFGDLLSSFQLRPGSARIAT